jgi:hypothetical protein
MVIDAAKGIEPRTLKLFEVCRLRDIPIITFVNKMDRESRDRVRSPRRDREDAGARHARRSPGRSAAAAISWAPTIERGIRRCAGRRRQEGTHAESTAPDSDLAGRNPKTSQRFIDELELVKEACRLRPRSPSAKAI